MPLTKITTGVIADNTITTSDIATGTIVSGDIADGTITSTDMALDPRNASNLSSGSVPSDQLDNVDTTGLQGDIALLAFKTQANGSLARYNLVDQSVDAFEDASGISASDSVDEIRDSSGKYYSGSEVGSEVSTAFVYTGADQVLALPSSATSIEVKLWAAGGMGGGAKGSPGPQAGGGGGGGSVEGVIPNSDGAGNTLTITVGQGGVSTNHNVDNFSLGVGIGYGGGGGGGGNTPPRVGGAGGGGSWIKIGATVWAAAGGGGGGNARWNTGSPAAVPGGGGGGTTGSAGQGSGTVPTGGTSSSGGTGGLLPNKNGEDGSSLTGGRAYGYANLDVGYGAGGGGGGGYFGGGGGAGADSGSNASSGAGGSSFTHASMTGAVNLAGVTGVTTQGGAGANQADADWVSGVGNAGGGGTSTFGGPGQPGRAVIKYTPIAYNNMTLESITTTTATAPTKGDLVFTYTNGAGTAVVGTNITAEYSADAGSTWTDFGIAAGDVQGTTGGHTIVTKNNITLTSTSGTNMRYRIKTLVQSVALQTRIHAVSLGWS